ncbi:MAG: DegT/DnrJ/EryC1/StrS family aminotransferase [Deltaproteobacteria bacterium]|nr:DegT/DnrJ/EryC1/StrS family aminotransferase [Deltaproteobacteria bacterium]
MNEQKNTRQIPLIKPFLPEGVKKKLWEVLESGYLTEGEVTREFEAAVRQYVGCGHALAVTSCTTGLEMALRCLGVGAGDEVIVPDYTYPATADVAAIVGARIVIVDVSRDTMLIDYDELESAVSPRTRAVIPVSGFGNPLDWDRLSEIRERHGIHMIEDAACSLGAEYRGVKVGNQGDISVFSLHPRKFVTTGEGGLVTTQDREWAEWMLSYKHFGMGVQDSRLTARFERIGSNYKMSNLLAAVGLVQMERIEELLERRLCLTQRYIDRLEGHERIAIPRTTLHGKHSRQSFCIHIDNRDAVMNEMRERGVEAQIGTYALHMHPAFAPSSQCRIVGELKGSRYAFDHCLALPLYHEMTEEDQEYVVRMLLEILERKG